MKSRSPRAWFSIGCYVPSQSNVVPHWDVTYLVTRNGCSIWQEEAKSGAGLVTSATRNKGVVNSVSC